MNNAVSSNENFEHVFPFFDSMVFCPNVGHAKDKFAHGKKMSLPKLPMHEEDIVCSEIFPS